MTSRPHCPSRWLSLVALLPAMAQTSCGSQADPSGIPGTESTGEILEGLGSGFHVTTRAYNDQRTGANTSETALTSSNVKMSTFGKIFTIIVDDQVYAQPLYASNVNVGGRVRNVVYIATVNNTVSAFDADIAGPPGTGNPPTLWSRNFNHGAR